ncbi:RHS repeat protein [Chitinolyticbacter meiyuanensis]|uniref:RHS repeat protein n=1 Tax=Chitinolyticbacter meiyuanensis TaxID=682798 RepID=UPI0016520B09|nr:RHS repeat protein [Chitinolyticbacter meiyuanensis]
MRNYAFQLVNNRWQLTSKSQPGGAGCDPASSALGYDANGNIKTRTDFNGATTSYVYDLSRNLETSRTEAVGTPQARTISTTWHPTFRLPATITEPGRVTTFTYDNTKGLLTQKQVTADGVSRIESWSYFPNGLLQTATDARGKVTHYTYDAQGNLATVTDPVGLVTRFTSYDPHGNVLTQVAPNGVTTTFTYDLRQRLKSRTTGGELTQFAYKPTGLLEKVTFPDQSWLQYRYDPAHRLIGIDHSNGSRIDYTLDNAGNTKREDRYDPAGVLAAAQQTATQAQSVASAPKAQ